MRITAREAYRPECMWAWCRAKLAVTVWECITWHGAGQLALSAWWTSTSIPVKYRDRPGDHLWPVLARRFVSNKYWLKDDNAPVYRARLVVQYKTENEIRTIPCRPAQSPDSNIIDNPDNLWWKIKKLLRNQAQTPWWTVRCLSSGLDRLHTRLREKPVG